jgi:single-strand DNA-binding protein
MYQKTILIGYLGRDPELSFTQAGTARATLSLATSETYTDREGKRKEETQWHRVIVWGKQAENVHKFLAKGRMLTVEGKIQYRTYDKEGVTHYVTEIKADRVIFMGGGQGKQDGNRRDEGGDPGSEGPGRDEGPAPGEPGAQPGDDDPIPF